MSIIRGSLWRGTRTMHLTLNRGYKRRRIHKHRHRHRQTHTHTHTHTFTHTHTHTHSHAHTHKFTHTITHTNTHVYIHIHVHIHMHLFCFEVGWQSSARGMPTRVKAWQARPLFGRSPVLKAVLLSKRSFKVTVSGMRDPV